MQLPLRLPDTFAPPTFLCCSCLAATDLYRYLAQEHDATIIGVLLGMAASKRWVLCGRAPAAPPLLLLLLLWLASPGRVPSTA